MQKIKNHSNLRWNSKKRKIVRVKTIKLSKDLVILFLLLITVCSIGYQQTRLEKDIESLSVPTVVAQTNEKKSETVKAPVQTKEALKIDLKAKYAYMNGNWSDKQLETRVATELKIMELAKKENFKHTSYLIRLIDCESMLGLYNENTKGNHPATSKDRGIAMINDYWHKNITDQQAYNQDFAIKWTMKMIDKGYQHRWSCDKIIKGKEIFR
jgi:predicted RND superfamily exporter protein